nr:Druantia anti-phage system protein DruA [Candidatus Accumulibacter phosphatis]
MQADGLLTLPAARWAAPRQPDYRPTHATDPQPLLTQPVHQLPPLSVRQVVGLANSRLWNEYITRYHSLGHTPMAGSQSRYFVFAGETLVALLSFGASAWKLAAREQFIGWHDEQRQKDLQLVVNNARFLILPWIQWRRIGIPDELLSKPDSGAKPTGWPEFIGSVLRVTLH